MEQKKKYTLGGLLEQTRKYRRISQESLTKGLLSTKAYAKLIKGEQETDKLVWDTMLARIGVSSLIYEGYISQEEYENYEKWMELRKQSNILLSMIYEKKNKDKITHQREYVRKLYTKFLDNISQRDGKVENLNRFFVGLMEGYCKKGEQQDNLKETRSKFLISVWRIFHTEEPCNLKKNWESYYLSAIELELLLQLADAYREEERLEEAEKLGQFVWEYQEYHAQFDDEIVKICPYAAVFLSYIKIQKQKWQEAWHICQEAMELLTETQNFRGLLYLLDQQKKLWDHWNEHWFESYEQLEETRQCILELMKEYKSNPYGIFPIYTLENVLVANEVIRVQRINQKITQSGIAEEVMEPENYSRYENGKLHCRWSTVSKLLNKLGMESEKETLVLDTHEMDILKKAMQIGKLGHQSQIRYSRELLRHISRKLDMGSSLNQQYVGAQKMIQQKETYQGCDYDQYYKRFDSLFKLTMPQYPNIEYKSRIWKRNEIILLNLYAIVLKQEGNIEDAIHIYDQILKYFNQYNVNKKYLSRQQILIAENYASYLSDIGNIKESLKLNQLQITNFLNTGRMWGIEKILYDLAWNQYELSMQEYQHSYKKAVILTLLQKDEIFYSFLQARKNKYQN